MVRPFVVFVILSALSICQSPAQVFEADPALTGFVTHSVSISDFDVNGFHVVSDAKTQTFHGSLLKRTTGGSAYFGEEVAIFGKINHKKQTIKASEIIFLEPEARQLNGIAVVDKILKPASKNTLLLRADGYVIEINSSTTETFGAPLSALSDIQPNTWIKYQGTLEPNGLLVADKADFRSNTITDREKELLTKTNYDPSAVPPDSKQNSASKVLLGWNPKKEPPYDDPVMEARLNRIGKSLIPSYQSKLRPDDPTKILFQFQVIDRAKLRSAYALPSGVILVPHQIIGRLENDSQIAAILADAMATALVKQGYRLDPTETTMTALNVASAIGGSLVPGLGFVGLATIPASKSIQTNLLEQSGRISLGLLHDAGYDVQQAPVAWWLLATNPSEGLAQTNLPPRAANLYRTIGLIWKNYPVPVTPADSAVPSTN